MVEEPEKSTGAGLMNCSGLVKKLESAFKNESDPQKAIPMEAYMRNQFKFYGINGPVRVSITKPVLKEMLKLRCDPEEFISNCWDKPQREWQYTAQEYALLAVKFPLENQMGMYDQMITRKSWWDTVDFIAVKLSGTYLKSYPDKITSALKRWNQSGNIWLQRTSILFQLKYKEATDEKVLFSQCKKYASSDEFFLRKAIGWALREYSKTNPRSVSDFIKSCKLSKLSVREASKYL